MSVDEGDGRRGWALLRASLHDPLLVLNVESDQRGGEPLPLLQNCHAVPGIFKLNIFYLLLRTSSLDAHSQLSNGCLELSQSRVQHEGIVS